MEESRQAIIIEGREFWCFAPITICLINVMIFRFEKVGLKLDHAAALAGLVDLKLDALRYKNYIKHYNSIVKECIAIVDALYEEKVKELEFLEWVVNNSLTLDGVVSTDECMLCPLEPGDVLPDYPLQHVKYFDMRE